jgi:hypothetical protein
VSPVKYELGFYILEDDILHSLRREDPQILHCINLFVDRATYSSSHQISPSCTNCSYLDAVSWLEEGTQTNAATAY